jgi:hypothetical protein
MSKRSQRKKKSKKKTTFFEPFPDELILYGDEVRESDVIVTDAGFDTVTYQLALKSFSWYEITNWWEWVLGEEEWGELDEELPMRTPSDNEILLLIEKLLLKFDWLPQRVDVLTARAVLNDDYQWVKLIMLKDNTFCFNEIFAQFEGEAISLGIKMRSELNNENLVIVNDNQDAVLRMQSPRFDDWDEGYFEIEDESEIVLAYPKIYWMPRKYVGLADRLTVEQATRIFFS